MITSNFVMSAPWETDADDRLVSEAEMELHDFHISNQLLSAELEPMDDMLVKMTEETNDISGMFGVNDPADHLFPFSSTTLDTTTGEIAQAHSQFVVDGVPFPQVKHDPLVRAGFKLPFDTETESEPSAQSEPRAEQQSSPSQSPPQAVAAPGLPQTGPRPLARVKAKSVVCLQTLEKIEKTPSYSNLQRLPSTGSGTPMGMRKVQSVGSLVSRGGSEPPSPRTARARTMERLRDKRQRRTYAKVVRYDVRQKIASNRPRVHGRFVKVNEEEGL
ncbi:hypothetical protein FVE85_4548 [Porphyridium purpureum]|uniref:CCT domain-containing protein n=1 Tax=Porphyridium purpureum TaxID=35688 RepID=A0A5J4YI58_PORPP|nr:hypothetical protein FVE85_4548 [Porphyridium purpureum]|eukprot:POR2013..scf297_16